MGRWVIVGCMGLWLGVAAPGWTQEGGQPLHVLLTNDDGFEAVGLQALKLALRGAGHRVTVVAPDRNYSGSSASMTLGPIRVQQRGEREYSAEATPAATALLGISAFADAEQPFDLLVSGTNLGANAGPATGISGTVGATTIAASGMGEALPALAFSTPEPAAVAGDAARRAHFDHVANFAVRLIAHLSRHRLESGELLPPGTRLNINYPLLPPQDVKGVKVAVQGRGGQFSLAFAEVKPGVYAPRFAAPNVAEATQDVPDSDVSALAQGYIAIVPLDTDYTAPAEIVEQTRKRLAPLSLTGSAR